MEIKTPQQIICGRKKDKGLLEGWDRSGEGARQSLEEQRRINEEHFAFQNDERIKKQNITIKHVGRKDWGVEQNSLTENEWYYKNKVTSRCRSWKSLNSPVLITFWFCQRKAWRWAIRVRGAGPFYKECCIVTRDLLIYRVNVFMWHFYIFLISALSLTPWHSLKHIKRPIIQKIPSWKGPVMVLESNIHEHEFHSISHRDL